MVNLSYNCCLYISRNAVTLINRCSALLLLFHIVQFQKIFTLPHKKGSEFPGMGGVGFFLRLKLDWNFFCGGGVFIFWNYTFC